jgi:hypothetical protein
MQEEGGELGRALSLREMRPDLRSLPTDLDAAGMRETRIRRTCGEFAMQAEIGDMAGTGTHWVTVFDEQACKLLGHTAEQLDQLKENDVGLETV